MWETWSKVQRMNNNNSNTCNCVYDCTCVSWLYLVCNKIHYKWTNQQTAHFTTSLRCRCFSICLGAFAKLRKATVGFVTSVCPSVRNTSAPIGRVFVRSDIWAFLWTPSRSKVSIKSDKNNSYSTLHEEKTNVQFWSLLIQFFLE